ncbi:MAG: sugar ABC transporter permease [Clostridia bacterium]|nr:sugar ABC transporter permease [Clostridia bacterium]
MKKQKRNRGIVELKSRYGYMFTTHWIIGIVIFFALPLIQSIIFSFSEIEVVGGGIDVHFKGIENYKQILLVDANYDTWVTSSVTSYLYSLPIIILLSMSLALILNQKFRGRLFFRALYFLPVIISTGAVINHIFRTTGSNMSDIGVSDAYSANMISVDDIVKLLDISGEVADFITTTISKIFDLVWSCGIQIVLFLAGLQSVPQSFFEASRVEGATKWEEFWFITFPMLSRVTLLVTIFTMVELITSERTTLIKNVYSMMRAGNYDETSAMMWFYFLICGAVMGLFVFLYQRFLVKRWE